MVGPGMFDGLAAMFYAGIIAVVLLVLVGIYEVADWFFIEETIESKTLIVPDRRLTTDGQTVDTIYIYRKK